MVKMGLHTVVGTHGAVTVAPGPVTVSVAPGPGTVTVPPPVVTVGPGTVTVPPPVVTVTTLPGKVTVEHSPPGPVTVVTEPGRVSVTVPGTQGVVTPQLVMTLVETLVTVASAGQLELIVDREVIVTPGRVTVPPV